MPDNENPIAKSAPEASPGEFDFAVAPKENPRMKKRSLKAKTSASLKPSKGIPPGARNLEREAPPLAPGKERPEYQEPEDVHAPDFNPGGAFPSPERPVADVTPASKPTQPTFASTALPSTPKKTESPHGTRPATLYYSNGTPKETEPTPPMKTTTAATASPAAQPTASTTRTSPVVDYRANIDRQAREQKSVGGVLAIVVYTLIGLFVMGALLAGYGAYVVQEALHDQSVNVSQLDARYTAEIKDLTTKLAATQDSLTVAQAQIDRQQEVLLKQQDAINQLGATSAKLTSLIQANTAALRTERATRAEEASNIRARLRDLEYRGPSTQRY